jgi:arylformamidase
MTQIIDITQPVTSDMVCWPGRQPPEHMWEKSIADGNHCNASLWKMSAHSGTHMDSPLHFVDGGQPIDRISPDVFIGPCTVVDLPSHDSSVMNQSIADLYRGEQRLLIRTRRSENKNDSVYQPHDALLTTEAASILLEGGLRLVGTDRLSVDDSRGDDFSLHHQLLGSGCVILEGLQLTDVTSGRYSLIAAPLRLTGTEASPVRALLQKT